MNKRYWHALNKETNPIGFGCWQIAGAHSIDGKPNGWGDVDERDAVNLLVKAINLGIDFFDTAQGYNNGKSEELLGKAISAAGKEVVVCSKIVLTNDEIKHYKLGEDFISRVEESLKRLNTDRLDVLLLHNPPDDINWKQFNDSVLLDLKKEGKIGTFGVSTRGLLAAKNVVEANFGTVLEWVFNIFERRPVNELFPLIDNNGFNFIARSPLSRGLINPKYLDNNPQFNRDDFRSTLPKDWIEWAIESVKKVRSNGILPDNIVKQALLYCLKHQSVTSSIVGFRTLKQLENILEINSLTENAESLSESYLNGIPPCFPKWT